MINKKRLKFKRFQKKRTPLKYSFSSKNKLVFGKYALRAAEPGILTKRQVEAVRRSITRHVKKLSKVWITCRVNRPVTSKPQGIRMGKGKGAVSQKTRMVSKGMLLFELDNIDRSTAFSILGKVKKKLPIQTYTISKGR